MGVQDSGRLAGHESSVSCRVKGSLNQREWRRRRCSS